MIHSMALFELPLLDRLFTWTNGQDEPTLARLDRVFFNHAWNDCFPTSFLTSLSRPTSDHVPLVVTASTKIPKSAFPF
jgi:endonuclease/exonuclease/phosphatase family metal-dependent hydrolase